MSQLQPLASLSNTADDRSSGLPFWFRLEDWGNRPALIDAHGRIETYGSLARLADQSVAGWGTNRRLLVIKAANSIETLAAYIGALRAGHVILLIEADGGSKLDSLLWRFRPHATWCGEASAWLLEEAPPLVLNSDLALLLPTSGATGHPKLVRLSTNNLNSNAKAIAEYLELTSNDRAITSLQWHYSYGLSVVHSTLASGGSLVLTEQSVIGSSFWRLFDNQSCTSFAGVPYTFELLERSGFLDRSASPSLRYFTVAGGKLASSRVKAFASWATTQDRAFFVMYGQTEASPRIAYLPPKLANSRPDSIGLPIPGGELRIAGANGAELATGETGELVYRGPNMMMGYAFDRQDLAKGSEITELRTGDIAVQEPDGMFRIVGRISRFSKLFGRRINLDDIERHLCKDGISAWAAGDDKMITIWLTQTIDAEQTRQGLLKQLGLPRDVLWVVSGEPVPILSSGKIDYVRILSEGHMRATSQPAPDAEAQLSDRLAALLNRRPIDPSESYIDLGADSLTFVQASLLVEEELGYLPKVWEALPLTELDRLATTKETNRGWLGLHQVESQAALRAFAILGVVLNHVAWSNVAGGAYLLLLLAGTAFARFRSKILYSGRIVAAFAPILGKIVVPFYLLLLVYEFGRGDVDIRNWLLIGNLFPSLQAEHSLLPFYWFIPNLVQTTVLFCLLFAIPIYRRHAISKPWQTGIGTLAASFLVALAFGAQMTLWGDPDVFAAGHFTTRTPFFVFYLFVFGWCVNFADTTRRRVLLTVMAPLMFSAVGEASIAVWLSLGSWVALWVPAIHVPKVAQRMICAIAASTFTIFIFHMLPVQTMRNYWPEPRPLLINLIVVVVAVTMGIVARIWFEKAGRLIRMPYAKGLANPTRHLGWG